VTSTYSCNKLNQMSTANYAGASITSTYYADDDRHTVTFPNGVAETYTYRDNGPLDTLSLTGPSGPLATNSYTYDDALNVATRTDGDGVHSFLYDGANRVTQAVHPSASGLGTEGFAYDRAGNRKDPANPSLWTYDTNNRIVQGGAATYTFDADGSVATKSDGSTFSHDVESRLTRYAGGSTTASYLYDSVGHRIRKTVNGTTTWFLWDGTSLLAEYDASGNRTMRYGYLPGAFVAVQVQDANGTYYVHSDAMQAPRVLTDSAGQTVWQARYATYGAAVVNGNGVGIIYNQRLPGQYFDSESALSYNYMRYYDAALGRYAESDPIGQSGGVNLYAYVDGNPLNRSDATGLAPHGRTAPSIGIPTLPTYPTDTQLSHDEALWLEDLLDRARQAINSCMLAVKSRLRNGKLSRCLDACASKDASGGKTWHQFCEKLSKDADRARCRSKQFESETNCRGYCFNEFGAQ